MSGDEPWRGELRERMAGKILFDEPAEGHTSIGVGGRIDALCFPESEGELASVVAFLRARGIPFLPVGNWTNLIVRGGGYRGVLISTDGPPLSESERWRRRGRPPGGPGRSSALPNW